MPQHAKITFYIYLLKQIKKYCFKMVFYLRKYWLQLQWWNWKQPRVRLLCAQPYQLLNTFLCPHNCRHPGMLNLMSSDISEKIK